MFARHKIDFSVLCPPRGRPNQMELLTDSVFELASDPETIEIIFYIDSADSESVAKAKELQDSHNISYIVGDRIVLSEMWNACCDVAHGEYFFHCGDDIIMRTKNWDSIVREKFGGYDDRIAFVYGSDGNPGIPDDFGTHGFLHRNWVDVVGYFVPPYFSSDYNDTWLNDVSRNIARHFKVDVLTEHMHPGCGKGEWDTTHQERWVRHNADNVQGKYGELHEERLSDMQKLRDFINERNN